MSTPSKPAKPRPRGRPEKRILNLDASPTEVFERIFENADKPDPAKRKKLKQPD